MIAVDVVEPSWYLILGAAMFAIGAGGLLVRRTRW